MADQTPVVSDLAAPILAGDPALSDEHRADLWDAFHGTKNAGELAQQLQPLVVPDDTKRRLLDAKKQATPPIVDPLDRVSAVMSHLSQIDPEVLNLAETHPNVLKALTAAFAGAEKGSGEPAGASKTASKGDTADGAKKPTPLAQPPRTDGLEHMPPIPDGHHRILTHDGAMHDIPAENIEKARAIDPRMHVLNP